MVARVGGELVPNSGPALIVDQGRLLTGALYAHARHIFFTLSKRRGLPALIDRRKDAGVPSFLIE